MFNLTDIYFTTWYPIYLLRLSHMHWYVLYIHCGIWFKKCSLYIIAAALKLIRSQQLFVRTWVEGGLLVGKLWSTH